ncbi:2-amino-4-hydroxy-6-hydroxymethyldihydropteridine diphosphokinase [Vibrio sp.]|nr:2-amino-4-hydroxy-6-hydroxymethyldihydropteridine diphosphokinase [Vibrio sp.]
MTVAYVGLGSNIDKHKHVEAGIQELAALGTITAISTIYECPALGFNGKSFFNLIIEIATSLTMEKFSNQLKEIEAKWGREPDAQKFQDRTLDLDIILFGDCVNQEKPQIPRDDIYKYPFVIQPLFELCPELVIPNGGLSIRQVWQKSEGLDVLRKVEPWFNTTIIE